MSETMTSADLGPTRSPEYAARLKRRYASERRFRLAGLAAIIFSMAVLVFLLVTMTINGVGGFQRTTLVTPIDFAAADLTAPPADATLGVAIRSLENQGLPRIIEANVGARFGADAAGQISPDAWRVAAEAIIDDPAMLDRRVTLDLPVSHNLAAAFDRDGHTELHPLADRLSADGALADRLDLGFLARSDATDPQLAGIWGALKGSMLTMLITLALAFPIGVLSALYLEEYAPRGRWTDLIEVSINNLAAVPSIIFGLLGLAVFLGLFPSLRSAPLIGGMTLALMTMPVIVISGRNAIKAVPPSIRDGALAIGASPIQVVFHHVLPLALPGILTGTIIGMARALGETAPLLMIGMRAFVATPPGSLTDPATVLPVQIFLWSDEIDRGFVERTSAAIIVLLAFLLVMNGIAIYLRNRFEKTW
jgi:phosphate transport system permease protein